MFITYKGGRKNVFKHGVKMELETLKTIQLVAGGICLTMFAIFMSSIPLMFLESVSDDFDYKLMDFIKITTSVAIFSFIL